MRQEIDLTAAEPSDNVQWVQELEVASMGESLDVSEDGQFVMWAGLKLPLSCPAGEHSQHVKLQSQLQHALLKLARGAEWDSQSFSTQVLF
jgi:hypothetical protein